MITLPLNKLRRFVGGFIFLLGIHSLGYAQWAPGVQLLCASPPAVPPRVSAETHPDADARSTNAYQLPFDTIKFNSVLGNNALDMVICVDGVTTAQQAAKADRYVDSLVLSLQQLEHYRDRFNDFNIFRIAKYSNEEGASWGYAGDTSVDNRYGSRFNAFGLPRLIVPDRFDTLKADVQEYVPQADLVLLLVFDKKYGGAGWRSDDNSFKTAIFTLDEESGWHLSDEVALHEMQHLMDFDGHGYPGDEYEDSAACPIYPVIPPSPNVTPDTVNQRKWEHCMHLPGVGFYPYAGICTGNYKPTLSCLMQDLLGLPQFCPVCRENSTAWLDSIIFPVYDHSPGPASYIGTYTFWASVELPVVNTYRLQWFIDDSLVAAGTDSLSVDFDLLDKSANHQLQLVCTDTDAHIIDTTLRRPWVVSWPLMTKDTTTGMVGHAADEGLTLAPNPASHTLYLTVSHNNQPLRIKIIALDGRLMYEQTDDSGRQVIPVDIGALPASLYLLTATSATGRWAFKFSKH